MDCDISNVENSFFLPAKPELTTPLSNHIKVIVEDYHSLYLEAFSMLLRINGFNVIGQAHNGTQLMESINPNELPDIAIINYKTSKRESLNAAHLIKQHYPVIKVIINTQFNYNIPVDEMKRIGIEGWIIKANHDTSQIIKALHLVYNGQDYFPENCPVL